MSSVVGIGGEGIILVDRSNTSKSVLKVAPFPERERDVIPTVQQSIDTDLVYEKTRPNELTANVLQHKNIIRYRDSMFEVINDNVFLITGTT